MLNPGSPRGFGFVNVRHKIPGFVNVRHKIPVKTIYLKKILHGWSTICLMFRSISLELSCFKSFELRTLLGTSSLLFPIGIATICWYIIHTFKLHIFIRMQEVKAWHNSAQFQHLYIRQYCANFDNYVVHCILSVGFTCKHSFWRS